MKFHIISDLHLEFLTYASASQLIERLFTGGNYMADILVMAGDLCTLDDNRAQNKYSLLLQQTAKLFKHVVIVPGNHEFYDAPGSNFQEKEAFVTTTLSALAVAAGSNVHMLQRSTITLEGIRIVGCTLWTDIEKLAYHSMRDSVVVFRHLGEYNHAHQTDLSWLTEELATRSNQTSTPPVATIVMTHHLPSHMMIAREYADSAINSGFVTDLDQLITDAASSCQLKLWVCGHTHTKVSAHVAGVELACNPGGYPGENHPSTVTLQPLVIPFQPLPAPTLQLDAVLHSTDVFSTLASYLDVCELLALHGVNQSLRKSCQQSRFWHERQLTLSVHQTTSLIQHLSSVSLKHLQRLTLLGSIPAEALPSLLRACPSLTHLSVELSTQPQGIGSEQRHIPTTDANHRLQALQLSATEELATGIEQAFEELPTVMANLQTLVLTAAPSALLKLPVVNQLKELRAPLHELESGWVAHIASFEHLERLELTSTASADKYYSQHRPPTQQLMQGFQRLKHFSVAFWSVELMQFYASRQPQLQSLQLTGPPLRAQVYGRSPYRMLDDYLRQYTTTSLQHLTTLTVLHWGLSPTHVRMLLAQPALRRLTLLTHPIAFELTPGMNKIETARAVEPVQSNLHYLKLRTDYAGVAALHALTHSTTLKVLSVHRFDDFFTELQQYIQLPPSIECLHWTYSLVLPESGDVSAEQVASWFPALRHLNVEWFNYPDWDNHRFIQLFSACRALETIEIEVDVLPTDPTFSQIHNKMLETMPRWLVTPAPTLKMRHRADARRMREKPSLQVMGLDSSTCATCSIVDKYKWYNSIDQ